jgi:hypothetical protein
MHLSIAWGHVIPVWSFLEFTRLAGLIYKNLPAVEVYRSLFSHAFYDFFNLASPANLDYKTSAFRFSYSHHFYYFPTILPHVHIATTLLFSYSLQDG